MAKLEYLNLQPNTRSKLPTPIYWILTPLLRRSSSVLSTDFSDEWPYGGETVRSNFLLPSCLPFDLSGNDGYWAILWNVRETGSG